MKITFKIIVPVAFLSCAAALLPKDEAQAHISFGVDARSSEGVSAHLSLGLSAPFAEAVSGTPTKDTYTDPIAAGPLDDLDPSPEELALLAVIKGPESGGHYNVIYGGRTFDNYSDHPRHPVRIKSGPNKGRYSSAAGAYQFLAGTWDIYQRKLGLPDFSPASQDAAALALARDAYYRKTGKTLKAALSSGDPKKIAAVGRALSGTWTSLPQGIEETMGANAFVAAFEKASAQS